nr:immunoglobulin heavy chain junction region [Mus musculus]
LCKTAQALLCYGLL